jgi:hypothetical protein
LRLAPVAVVDNTYVSQVPDAIDLERDRDFRRRSHDIWIRRGLFGLICVVPILALLNLFGQRPETTTGTASAVQLSVSAPSRVRGGLLYQARFRITPTDKKLTQATLVLASGWLDGMTINTLEPSPVSETSINGKLSLDLGPIPAGQSFVQVIDYQVNPTNVGHRDQSVTLYDGNKALVTVHRTITVFP